MKENSEDTPKSAPRLSQRYRLNALLGKGGAGEVYSAWDTQLRRTVAIKRVKLGGLHGSGRMGGEEGSSMASSTWMEATCLASVRHPNITAVYDFGEEGGEPYLVMEYVQGETLAKRVERGPLRLEDFLSLARQVLSGMAAAHQCALIHRDLKPENLMLTQLPTGEFQVKILDFGIAKYVEQATPQTVDVDGSIKGSIHWMSPEQLTLEPVDHRSDLYSLGCVFYHALSAVLPFGTGSAASVMRAHLLHEVEPLQDWRPELPEGVCRWVMGLISHNPRERPQSAIQALESLEAVVRSVGRAVPLERPPEPVLKQGQSLAHLETGRIALGGSLGVVGEEKHPAGGESAGNGALKATGAAAANAEVVLPMRGKGRWGWIAGLGVLAVLLGGALAWKRALVGGEERPAVVLRIQGSNTIGSKMAPMLVEGFLRRQGAQGIHVVGDTQGLEKRIEFVPSTGGRPACVEIRAHGSRTAFSGLKEGLCDLGVSSSPVLEEERAQLLKLGLGDMRMPACEKVVALDGLAVIVHPSNPVAHLSLPQIRAVFSGTVRDWAEVGRPTRGPIHLYVRDANSGTFDSFKAMVLRGAGVGDGARRFEDSGDLSDALSEDADGIGFVGLPYIRNCRAVAVSDGEVDPLLPTQFTVSTEDYPLSRRLYFYTAARPASRMVRGLIDFTLSDEGQEIVGEAGFVKLAVDVQRVPIPAKAPADYLALAQGAERLSLTFRFQSGEGGLDSKAEFDLGRLLRAMGQSRFNGRQVALVGFSENTGDEGADLRSSEGLVQLVAQELRQRGLHAGLMSGVGSRLSVSDDASEVGRARNRRVEVWLRQSPRS